MRKWVVGLMILALLAAGTYAFLARRDAGPEGDGGAGGDASMPVVRAPDTVVAEGEVVPVRTAILSFPAGDIVAEVLVAEGHRVQEGQPLMCAGFCAGSTNQLRTFAGDSSRRNPFRIKKPRRLPKREAPRPCFAKTSGEPACKPGSVEGDHLSRAPGCPGPPAANPRARRATSLPSYLALLPVGFA